MRDREQPLDQGIPPVEVSFYVGVINFQVDRLLVDGGRVSVREQARIGISRLGIPVFPFLPRRTGNLVHLLAASSAAFGVVSHLFLLLDDSPNPISVAILND